MNLELRRPAYRVAKNYLGLLGAYGLLAIGGLVLYHSIDQVHGVVLRLMLGGWVFWAVGPLYSKLPLYLEINPFASLIYHIVFLICYACSTFRLKRVLPRITLLLPTTWLFGYLLLWMMAGSDFFLEYLHGRY